MIKFVNEQNLTMGKENDKITNKVDKGRGINFF